MFRNEKMKKNIISERQFLYHVLSSLAEKIKLLIYCGRNIFLMFLFLSHMQNLAYTIGIGY